MHIQTDKKHKLSDILSDKVSVMETDDGDQLVEEAEAASGFCVECKDQKVRRTPISQYQP